MKIGLGILFIAPILMVASLLGTTVGYFAGWVVAGVFVETVPKILEVVGFGSLELKEVGAAIGFISMFFRNYSTK